MDISRRFSFNAKEAARILSMVLCLCLCLCFVMISTMDVAFCENSGADLSEGIGQLETIVNVTASEIYNVMRAIVIPIVICFIAYAGLLFLVGGSKGTESARKILISCVAAVIFVVFAPIIGQYIGNQFKDYGNGDFSQYNPL